MKHTFYKVLILLISVLTANVTISQTLYWVGNSGNFNDPKNWSEFQGGKPSNKVPDQNTSVVFKDNVVFSELQVNFTNAATVRSISIETYRKITFTKASAIADLTITEGFSNVLDNSNFNSLVDFHFKRSSALNAGLVSTGNSLLKNNIYFEDGKWVVTKLRQEADRTLTATNADLQFSYSSLSLGKFLVSDKSSVNLDHTVLRIATSMDVNPFADVKSKESFVNKQKIGNAHLSGFNFNAKLSGGPVNLLPCMPTPTVIKPSCVPGCDGTIIVNIPAPGCFGGAASGTYNLLVNNNPTCSPISGLNNVTPGNYTLTNVCFCQSDYVFLLFDANSFAFLESVNASVTQPLITSFVVNTKTITCNAACNGSINIAVLGGTSPYTFTVSRPTVPSFTTSSAGALTVTNVCAGVLTVAAQDSKFCSSTFTFNFAQPAAISPVPLTTSVSCNNQCTGAFQVSPTGGIPGYTVNLTGPSVSATSVIPAAGSANISSLCIGPVSATITDVNGCSVTVNSNITQPPALTVTPTQTNLACFSTCNGAASVAVTGGTSPYSYTWSPGPGNTAGITGLCAGTQTVTILDANSCPRTQTFNLTAPPALSLTVNQTNITCNALCNGSATALATGGSGTKTYTWTGPAPFVTSTNSVITNLCPGVYTITAGDASSCTISQTINITQPPALTITANVTNNTCFSTCAGSSTVVVTGGNGAPYSYTWSPTTTSVVNGATVTASNLCAGVFSITARDASLCPITTTINITQPTSITINPSSSSLTCNGVCNGSINANPTGGTGAPYTFTLVTPTSTLFTAPPYTNLCAGLYTLTVRDASSCAVSQTFNIAQPNPLLPSISSNSVSCFNACNGSLAGSVLGGTPSYTLFWATPTGTVAGGNLINQCAGVYTFNVRDANSCTVSATFTLVQPSDITATLNPVNPTCNGGNNGSIGVVLAGGTPGYTLNWNIGSGNPNTGLGAGNYSVTVTDANNCLKTFTATLVNPPAITLAVNVSSVSCASSCDGSATVTPTGGTAPFTYQFNTAPVTTNTTGIVSGLCPGNYIVTVTDANGCTNSIAFTIGAPPLLTAAITGILPTCNVCTGASTVTVNGGTPTYTINWLNNVPAVVATGSTASGLCLGTYTASVVDSKGCTASATVNIVNTVSVTVVTGGSSILCNGVCNASATANALGGTLPYTYSWTTAPTQTTQTATNLCAGTYTVRVTDQIGCSNTGTITFTQPPAVTVTSTQTNIACFGNCNGVITTTVAGGTSPYTYSWSPGGQTTTSLTGLCSGNYTLNLTDLNNCSQTRTFNVTQSPSLTATFTLTNPSSCVLNNGSVCATPSGGSGAGYTFTWSPAGTGGANNSCNVGLGAGNYNVTIKDGAGCTTTLAASLSSPSGPTVNVTSASVTCNAAINGSAVAVATGVGPFTFTWSPSTTSAVIGSTSTATGLGSGNYNISVLDGSSGCITSQTFNITQPTQATVTSNVSNPLCSTGCNGSIVANVNGGTPGYTFAWLPAASITVGQGTGTVTALCSGNYTLNVTDANSCITTRTFVLTSPSALTVTATQANVQCNASCNGSVSLNVTGGTVPYTFTWSPVGTFTGSTNNTVNNLCANIYSVTVRDNNNCASIQTYTITEPTAISHTVTSTNLTCNSICNGTASMTVSGGVPTYSFSWSSLPATTQSVGALCAGNYTATVVDGNGCISTRTFALTQPPALTITATPTSPLCNAACNGSITTNVTGGNGGYTYAWVPSGSGANPTGLCPGNYVLTVTDASLCTGNAAVTLTNPPAVAANVTFTNPLCNSNCNGVAFSNPVNATAPVTYSWSTVPTQTTQTASGLCAGAYTVNLTDSKGCTAAQTFTLTNPPLLNVSASSLPSSCSLSNGSITISPSGGTPGYTYTWSPPIVSTNSFVNNVGAGIYSVTVSDSQGCTNTVQVIVNNSNGPSAAAYTSTNVACSGSCTGAASITTITGGTPGYTVAWLVPSAPSTVNPITNLCSGSYTAQITDQLSCVLFTAVTISQPLPILDNEVISNALCAGVCNGSISLSPSGGTAPYTYSWSTAATTSVVTGLCVGTHTANITDNAGCILTATYAVSGQLAIASSIVTTSNTCFGNCLGTASVTSASGGIPPYNFNWSNTQTGPIASSLCNGNYSVTVTDFNGCQNTFSTSIVSPNAIVVTPSVSSPSCGLCNGSSSVNVSGGTSPFTYSWTSGGTAATEGSLCAGLYQVTITDNNGCSQLQNISISNSSGITGETFNIQNEICFNDCNGSVTVTPIGGNLPISFNWISPASTNSVVTGLCGGTYFVQMTDAQGCTRTSSVSVNSATNIIITPTITAPSCAATNGSVVVGVTGGSGVYTYSWLPAGNTASLTNIGPGVYTLSVNDGSCTKTTQVIVNSSTAPMILFDKTDNGCSSGICTGSVVITPTLGTPGYNVSWSNGNITNTVTNLCSGVITVTVTDLAGCSASQSFSISENPAVNLSLPIVQEVSCANNCDGSINLVPSGGVLPFVITWIPATTVTPANPLTNLCAGNYTAVVTDINGCSASRTINLVNPPSFSVDANITNATCNTSNDGAATTTVSGGTPSYTFAWSGPATFTTQNITNVSSGTYSLLIIDSRGCVKDTVFTIAPGFTVNADAGRDTSFCFTNSVILNGSNSQNAVMYEWTELTAPVNTVALTVTTSVLPPVGTNTYVLFVQSSVAACFDRDTIVVNSFSIPLVDAGPSQTISLFSSTQIGGSPTSATALTFTWLPTNDLNDPTIPNPIASNTLNTTYTVIITDANGCTASDTVNVSLYPEIKIPNGFSPNADGRNDTWIIDNLEQFPANEVEIYNRWGELLLREVPYKQKFDGKYNGKDLPVGTYYYIIMLNHPAYPKAFTGPLTIFR